MTNHIDIILGKGDRRPSQEKPNMIYLTPIRMGGPRAAANRYYLSNEDWSAAQVALLEAFRARDIPLFTRRYAKDVMRDMARLDLGKEADPLRLLCLSLTERDSNRNQPWTLYHEDGRQAYGLFTELAAQTGLDHNRIRDIAGANPRRRYASGWCGDRFQALIGRKKAGRKPARIQDATEGTELF
jgi:hypothetical protein